MGKKSAIILAFVFVFSFVGCGKQDVLSEYDTTGISFIAYSDIDSVCENNELIAAGKNLLNSQADNLLLSYVMDSAIELTKDELGEYDHLIFTNPLWVEKFSDTEQLKPVEYDSLTNEMQSFLEAQMPILTVDGSVLPDGVGLYRYDDEFWAFPVNVTLGAAEPIKAKKPLIVLVENPTEALNPASCLLPLTSSGNILFDNEDELQSAFSESELNDYGEIQDLQSIK